MKRLLALALALLLPLSFASCEEKKPKDISDQHYSYGKKALEITDRYLDFEITAFEAVDELEALIAREDELPKTEYGEKNHLKNYYTELDTLLVFWRIQDARYHASPETSSDILELRNSLAKNIGCSKRKE